jgi:phosphoglycerol transferase MdoB-like AlkP superfamily enzyme
MHNLTSESAAHNHNRVTLIRVVVLIGCLAALCSGLFFIARLATLILYSSIDNALANPEVWQALWMGLRLDIATMLRLSLLGLLLSLICALLPFRKASQLAWWSTIFLGYLLIASALFFAISNMMYISFFDRPIDSFAFQGLTYGWQIAAKSIAGLDNFIFSLLALILLLPISVLIYRRLFAIIGKNTWGKSLSTTRYVVLIALYLTAFILLGRGTVTTFPLSHRHMIISAETDVNNLIPNGVIATYYGYQEFKKSRILAPADDAKGRALFQSFFGYQPTSQDLFAQFFTSSNSSEFLQQNPPNVVLHLVESMGQALLLNRFNGGFDTAGSLRQHLDEDLYFRYFLPSSDDTQKSLMSIMLNTEYSNISRSTHQQIPLETSAAKIFKRAGYRTVFVYAGFEGINNRGNYLKQQGFDEFIGANRLNALYPEMGDSVWGGEDKYIYEHIWSLLSTSEQQTKPLFIVSLSVTNHPPYVLPKKTRLPSETINGKLRTRLQNLPAKSVGTFKYTNEHLGTLLSRVKHSDLKNNTIMAVTGDHAIRGMSFAATEQLHQISVPFYLYVPTQYMPDNTVDTGQIASHKDIMPTLYNLALSDAKYPNLGRHLLAPVDPASPHNFAYHSHYFVMDNLIYNPIADQQIMGKKVLPNLDITEEDYSAAEKNKLRGAQYSDVLDWMTRYQLTQPR